jgi:hypothetical protein
MQDSFKCAVKLTEKSARRARKVAERKMDNMHLLEAGKANYVKAGKARKVTERKLGSTHLLEACETIFKYDGEKGGKGRKEGRKKDGQYAFSRSRQG